MKGAFIIGWRDLKSIFTSPLFYVTAGFCTAVWSGLYLVAIQNFANNSSIMMQRGGAGMNIHDAVFQRHLGIVHLIMILAVPALTMRLLAEEKSQRTYDLLLTSPISSRQIVGGKMMAGILAAWGLVAVSFVYPAVTSFYADIQWGQLLGAYLAIMLLVATYVAVGLFASSLTESVFLAIVMGVIFNVVLLVLGGSGVELAEGSAWRKVFEHLNLGYHYIEFVGGSIRTTSLVFFASIVFLYGFMAERVVESSRWR